MRRHHRVRPPAILAGLLAVFLAVLTVPIPVAAQTGGADRVASALQATDAALERAQRVVGETDSQRARDLLERALRIQRNAWQQFRDGRTGLAASLTAEARNLAARAVGMAREDVSVRNRARHEGEKARRALSHAHEVAAGEAEPQVFRLLEQAGSMIERAEVNYGEQRFQAALRLAVSAQQLVRQAIGILGEGTGDAASRILRELERTDHLIERVRTLIEESGSPDAQRMFEHGQELQSRAWEAYRLERMRAAAVSTREARSAVNRARSLAQGPIDPDMVDRALTETDRLLARAADRVADSDNETAAGILERARSHQEKAMRLHEEGSLRQALAETRVARGLAKRTIRVADSGGSR